MGGMGTVKFILAYLYSIGLSGYQPQPVEGTPVPSVGGGGGLYAHEPHMLHNENVFLSVF